MSRSFGSAAIVIVATLVTSAARSQAQGDRCSLSSKEDAVAALAEASTGPEVDRPTSGGARRTVTIRVHGSDIHSIQLNLTRLPASSVAHV